MKALFVELPAFARFRNDYLDDEGFRGLQTAMILNPEAGDYDKDELKDLSPQEKKALKSMLKAELEIRR